MKERSKPKLRVSLFFLLYFFSRGGPNERLLNQEPCTCRAGALPQCNLQLTLLPGQSGDSAHLGSTAGRRPWTLLCPTSAWGEHLDPRRRNHPSKLPFKHSHPSCTWTSPHLPCASPEMDPLLLQYHSTWTRYIWTQPSRIPSKDKLIKQ